MNEPKETAAPAVVIGMELLDVFAAVALHAMLTRPPNELGLDPSLIADRAYYYAKFMLLSRAESQEQG